MPSSCQFCSSILSELVRVTTAASPAFLVLSVSTVQPTCVPFWDLGFCRLSLAETALSAMTDILQIAYWEKVAKPPTRTWLFAKVIHRPASFDGSSNRPAGPNPSLERPSGSLQLSPSTPSGSPLRRSSKRYTHSS